jgi:hypothetical protein
MTKDEFHTLGKLIVLPKGNAERKKLATEAQ